MHVNDSNVGPLTQSSPRSTRMHGIDESLHLGDFRRAILTEALMLAGLAE